MSDKLRIIGPMINKKNCLICDDKLNNKSFLDVCVGSYMGHERYRGVCVDCLCELIFKLDHKRLKKKEIDKIKAKEVLRRL